MKKNLFIYLLFLGFSSAFLTACNKAENKEENKEEQTTENNESQAPSLSTPEGIDAFVADLENKLKGVKGTKKEYKNPDPNLYYDYDDFEEFLLDGKLVKLVSSAGEEGYMSRHTMYFNNDQMIFAERKAFYELRSIEGDDMFSLEKFYLVDQKLIKTTKRAVDEYSEDRFASAKEEIVTPNEHTYYNPKYIEGVMTRYKAAK